MGWYNRGYGKGTNVNHETKAKLIRWRDYSVNADKFQTNGSKYGRVGP